MPGLWIKRRATSCKCPVCWVPVEKTGHNQIFGHFDRAGGYCPGSFKPFDIALTQAHP